MDQCDTITNQMHLNADNVESAARNRGHSCLVRTERRRLSSVFVINLIEASPCGFARHSVRSVCRSTLARCLFEFRMQSQRSERFEVSSAGGILQMVKEKVMQNSKCIQNKAPECTQPILLFDCRHERHCRKVLSATSEGLICTDQDTET